MKRLDGIDILRGTAVTAVIIYHFYVLLGFTRVTSFAYVKHFGAIGVPLFFVISGYLIFRSIDNSLTRRGFKWGMVNYMLHRLFRILPAYYFNLFVMVLLASFFIAHEYYYSDSFFRQFFSHLIFTPYFIYKDTGFGINGAYWTLDIEMLWYLIVPVLFLFFNRLWLLLLLSALSFVYLYGLDTPWFDQWFKLTSTASNYNILKYYYYTQLLGQINFFIAGILIYKYHTSPPQYAPWIAIAILTGFIGIMGHIDPSLHFMMRLFLHLTVVSLLFLLLYTQHIKGVGLLAWTGKISYSLYLWHMPILYVMQRSDILHYRSVPETVLFFIFILFAVSSMSYYFTEEGGFALRKKLTQRLLYAKQTLGENI